MSRKSKRYGNFRKKEKRVSRGGSVGVEDLCAEEVLAIGMDYHFGDVISPSDKTWEDLIEILSCDLCFDNRSGECPGKLLRGGDVVDCIGGQMGVRRAYPWMAASNYVQ
jgi:hypothetical protein